MMIVLMISNITIVIVLLLILIVSSSTINDKISLSSSTNYAVELYKLAYIIHNNSINNHTTTIDKKNVKIHLIRVPKASSSSLSAVSRRIVGCTPPGPCCKWPGEPKGTCPSKELFACHVDGKVIGCVHHYPNYDQLLNPTMMSISMMRDPNMRALSAFFYPGIHHNSDCTKSIVKAFNGSYDKCFIDYTSSQKWQNIVVKLVTGVYAYKSEKTCRYKDQCKRSLELAVNNLKHFTLMGVSEMWPLSLLLLHTKLSPLFPSFVPLLEEFTLGDSSSNNNSSVTRSNNDSSAYKTFKAAALAKYSTNLDKQNSLDTLLYRKVVELFCEDLHKQGLWSYPLVRQYWQEKTSIVIDNCQT